MSDPVVTVTTTVMDGTVVRWHRDVQAAQTMRPVLSACREGVLVHGGYLTAIPDEWVAAARQAHELLARNPHADLSHLATHRHRGPSNGPLEPVGKGGD